MKIQQRDTFENELLQAYIKQLTDLLAPFTAFDQFFNSFVQEVNQHYDTKFLTSTDTFECFDQYTTPLIENQLLNKTIQCLDASDQIFTSELYLKACQTWSQATQEEFNIKSCFIQKDTVLQHPFQDAIKLLKQLPFDTTFTKKCLRLEDIIFTIQQDCANFTQELLTGEDIADILTYIAMRAAVRNLPEILFLMSENLPHQLKSGKIGFNLMNLQLAVCGLCGLSQNDLNCQQKVRDTTLKNKHYMLPCCDLYQNLLSTSSDDNKPFVLIEKTTLSGYIPLVLLDYVFNDQIALKIACVASRSSQQVPSYIVSLNPEISASRGNKIDTQMTGKRIMQFTEVMERGNSLLIVKQLESLVSQKIHLLYGKEEKTLENMAKAILLLTYGCCEIKHLVLNDELLDVQTKRKQVQKNDQLNLIAKTIKLDDVQQNIQVFEKLYKDKFNFEYFQGSYYSQLAGIIRFTQNLFLTDLNQDILDNIQQINKVDCGFFSRAFLSYKVIDISMFLPCAQIIRYVKNKISNINHMFLIEHFPLFYNLLSQREDYSLFYPEEIQGLPDTITPLSLQQLVNCCQFYISCFIVVTKKKYGDIFLNNNYLALKQDIMDFQKQHFIEPTGVFDNLTLEWLVKCVEIDFLSGRVGQRGVQLQELPTFI